MRQVAGKWKWALCLLMLSVMFMIGGSRKVSADPVDSTTKCRVVFANARGVVSTSTYRNWGQIVDRGEWIKLPQYSQDGYKCYWVLKTGGISRKYYPGANYRITKNTKFYLYRYKEYNIRFMTVNGRKEYLSKRQVAIKGQYVTLPKIASASSKQIVGWRTSLTEKTYKKAGSKVKVTGNMKFYPVYKKVTGVNLRTVTGALWRVLPTDTGEQAVFPSVDLRNGNMCLGWSRSRGKTSQPQYYPGDKVPTKSGNYYMVVFTKSRDHAPTYLNTPQKHDRVFFVGDSRTAGIEEVLGNQKPDNVKFIYKGAQGLTWFRRASSDGGYNQLVRELKKLPKRMNKAVVMNLGVNDMKNVNIYIRYMKSLAVNLKRNYNCDMYYMSINPVNSAMIQNYGGVGLRTEQQVKSFNSAIYRNLCSGRNKYFTYINTCGNLQKYGWISDRHNAGIHDGLHYSDETYLRIYDYCIRTLNR